MLVWITLPRTSRNLKTGKFEYSLNGVHKESDFRVFTEEVEEPFVVEADGEVFIIPFKNKSIHNVK